MARTAIVADKTFKDHDTGPGHPETAERLDHINKMLEDRGFLSRADRIELREASEEAILRIHTKSHFERIAATANQGRNWMDGDTPTSDRSFKTALLAAGSLLAATDAVASGDARNAMAFIRPPGHHAESDRAMGFCLFNNVAIAAAHALAVHKMERVMIVDWDVHHGNGTQHSFYSDPRVLYFSTHRYPFYPGSGMIDEIGEGEGRGRNVNVPLPGGSDDAIYDAAFAKVLEPVARGYKPQMIFISAGFDPHRLDPLGGMDVTEEGFARMAGRLEKLADELCDGKIVLTLEGGYHLKGQALAVAEVASVLMGESDPPEGELEPEQGFDKLVQKEKEFLADFWPGIGS